MNPEQWQKLKAIFDQAYGLARSNQAQLLDSECTGDPEVRGELEELLEAARGVSENGFMESGALEEQSADLLRALSRSLEGTRVGPWRVIREIGTGGMGAVYLAQREDGVYEAQAALKIIRRGMDSATLLRRFYQERQILAELNDPGIARLIDGGMCPDGRPYLAMEYIEGCAIDEFCKNNAVSVKGRLELFLQVCAAVQSAHQHLVVHRDIKPGNILVTAEGKVRLLDFGVAKLLDSRSSLRDADLTCVEGRILTPEYASPEQVLGGTITVGTDVYALGVLLYRLLTGVSPYRVTSMRELKQAVCEQEPVDPSAVNAGGGTGSASKRAWSRDLDLITLQALRKEPSRRYQSVEQLAEDVRRYLGKMPVNARPDSTHYRVGKFISRHRVAVSAAMTAVIVLVFGVIATTWQARIARYERGRAERRSNETRHIANSILFELYESLREVPGTTAARQLLADRGTELYRGLSQDAGSDPGLRRELAAGYRKLADIKGAGTRSNTGHTADARADYERAAAIYEALVADRRVQADDLYYLGTTYTSLATIAAHSSLNESDHWVSKANQAHAKGMQLWPSDGRFRRGLASALQQIGNNQAMRGNLQQDLVEHQKAFDLLQPLVNGKDAKDEDWVSISFAHKRLAAILINQGRLDEALHHDQLALELDQELLRHKSDDVSKRFAITFAYNDIGYIYLLRHEFVRALRYYRQGLSIREALQAADPNDSRAKHGVGNSWCYIGDVFRQQGDPKEALSSYSKCFAIRQSDVHSPVPGQQSPLDLAEVLCNMGLAHTAKALKESAASSVQQDWLDARDEFRSALEIYGRAGVSANRYALSNGARLEAESGLTRAERHLQR